MFFFACFLMLLSIRLSVASDKQTKTIKKIASLKANKILFLGNSLTLHGPRPDINWSGNWGMAATAAENDYVHRLTRALNDHTREDLLLGPANTKGNGGVENIRNIADVFERGYRTYEASKLNRQLHWKADIVIIQCGENVPAKDFDATAFQKAFRTLLNDLKAASDPHIFVTGNILWGNTGLDKIKKKVCAEDPAKRTFVEISEYATDVPRYGPVGHPNDQGMKLIADTLFAAIIKQAKAATGLAEAASRPSRHKTLFLDDHHIVEMTGLRRVMHRPVKKGAVFLPRGVTDGIRVQTASAPVWVSEENVFKLFYMGVPYRKHGWIAGEIGSALAVSKDGLEWKRPVLNQVEIGGSTANNRFFVDPDLRWGANKLMEVIHDPHDPDPQRRYKGLLGAIGRKPVVSPDGIDWKTIGAKTIPSSDTSTLIYDEQGRRYLAILKNGTKFGRSAAVAFSTDFKTWTTPRTTFHTDEQDQELALERIQKRLANPKMQNPMFNDRHPKTGWTPPGFDPAIGKSKIPTWRAETYKLAVFPYEGLYIGMPQIYYPTGPALPARNNTVGFHEIQLAFNRDPQLSREGWKRLGDRQPFIETSGLDKGLAGNFDRQQLGVLNRPVVMKDELWFYYTGAKGRSLPYKLWPDGTVRNEAKLTPDEKADFDDGWIAICLATLRLDGFVSLTAGKNPGQITTKPFVASGDRLLLNVDVSGEGQATVEVLDEDMQAIDGFELTNSIPLRGRAIEQAVRWTKADWSQLAGSKVRLRIRLRKADLYAFWTEE